MNCPDAATFAEVSAVYEGDAHATLAHITTCAACHETLALCDQLAVSAHAVEVPAALYARLDAAIMATAGTMVVPTAAQPVPATDKHSGWYTPMLATVALGLSLVLIAAMAPSTSGRPVEWPALIVLSVLGGATLTMLERRTAR